MFCGLAAFRRFVCDLWVLLDWLMRLRQRLYNWAKSIPTNSLRIPRVKEWHWMLAIIPSLLHPSLLSFLLRLGSRNIATHVSILASVPLRTPSSVFILLSVWTWLCSSFVWILSVFACCAALLHSHASCVLPSLSVPFPSHIASAHCDRPGWVLGRCGSIPACPSESDSEKALN